MNREEKIRRIESRNWYHSIEIEPGLVTPGSLSAQVLHRMLERLRLPTSLAGLTVLDIGAWDGFYSFEAERRGAKRVVAYDLAPPDYFGFATAKELLGSNVEYRQGSVYDLRPEEVGTFDVVLFLGVFYHLRYPLLALDRIREVCVGCVLLETHSLDNNFLLADGTAVFLDSIDPRLTEVPLYHFYRADELVRNDFSNWFSPNRKAVEDGLWTAGFKPERLAEWGDRVAYKGTRLEGVPEYLQATYEGVKFVPEPDGGQRCAAHERTVPHSSAERRHNWSLRAGLRWVLVRLLRMVSR
jgi:tRNA (mo5U34)-methyltransferase